MAARNIEQINREFEIEISTLQPEKQAVLRRVRKHHGAMLSNYLHTLFSSGVSIEYVAKHLEEVAMLVRYRA